jgi:hypothetical protein
MMWRQNAVMMRYHCELHHLLLGDLGQTEVVLAHTIQQDLEDKVSRRIYMLNQKITTYRCS